jgi:hypothetical protein
MPDEAPVTSARGRSAAPLLIPTMLAMVVNTRRDGLRALKRAAYVVAAAVLILGAVRAGGVGTWQFWVFLVAPDIALLVGAGRGLERGQLHPRAVPLYNSVHRLLGPAVIAFVALSAGAYLGAVTTMWLIAACAWGGHICVDRALGFGLRTREGFQRS